MNYIQNCEKSWEKQSVYQLDNGYIITVEHNPFHGQLVTMMEGDEVNWQCHDGLTTLPSFASDWVIDLGAGLQIVKPMFLCRGKSVSFMQHSFYRRS